jgi:hypothetical protein
MAAKIGSGENNINGISGGVIKAYRDIGASKVMSAMAASKRKYRKWHGENGEKQRNGGENKISENNSKKAASMAKAGENGGASSWREMAAAAWRLSQRSIMAAKSVASEERNGVMAAAASAAENSI